MIRILLITAMLTSPAAAQTTSPARDCLVGIEYFAGWWRQPPNKYVINNRDWRQDFPERRALLGEFNEQATMDREIDAAASHGVDFFQILWYRPSTSAGQDGPSTGSGQDSSPLNAGLEQFLASPSNSKLKFTVEYCNHPPFGIRDQGEWEKTCRQFAAWMKHPSYLHVDGKAVFKLHGLHYFLQDSGSAKGAAERIATLRKIARDEGAGELLISAGVMAIDSPPPDATAPFDFLTTYMDIPQLPQRPKLYPYAELVKLAEAAQHQAPRGEKPYVPYVPAGWDPRPWHDPRPSFEMPTRQQWIDALKTTRQSLDGNEHLGVPTSQGRQKMLLIYAWNEFGEGGIVAPTEGKQYDMLEGIDEVFGR